MDINKLSDKIIVKKNVAEILSDIKFETPKEKIAALSMIYSAERQLENPLVLEESDYETVLQAVMTGKFIVDTGLYFVNVGKPVNREEFLACSGIGTESDDGDDKYYWEFESRENAKLFTMEEINTIIPKAYRSEDYIVLEREVFPN